MPYFFCFILAAKVRHRASTLSLSVTFCHYLSLFVTICHSSSWLPCLFRQPDFSFFFAAKVQHLENTLSGYVGMCRDVSVFVGIKFISLFLLCPSGLFFSFRCKGTTSCKHVVRFCPLLSAFVRFCPLLSASVRFCPSFLGFRLLYFLCVKIIRNLCLACDGFCQGFPCS